MKRLWPFRFRKAKVEAVADALDPSHVAPEAALGSVDIETAASHEAETGSDIPTAVDASIEHDEHSARSVETLGDVGEHRTPVVEPTELGLSDATDPPRVAPAVDTASFAVEADVGHPSQEPKQGRLHRMAEGLKAAAQRVKTRGAPSLRPHTVGLPIRVIIGYLPEVNGRDAREYALGMAEKHFEQMGLSYFTAFEYANGYAFEAHEGGPGKAYLPQIIEHFDAQGPYHLGENHSVVIKTATRLVEVQRMRDGLAAIMLPESATAVPTEWLTPTKSMAPGLNRRTAFFYSGVAVFATGLLAMLLSATIFRVQTYQESPAPKVESVSTSSLPRSQWSRIEALPPNSYVRAVRFRGDKWEAPEIVTDTPPVTAPAASDAPAAQPSKK